MKKILYASLFLSFLLPLAAEETYVDKRQILYLMSIREVEKAIDAYLTIYKTEKKHDFELLEKICLTLLDMGTNSPDPEDQLLALYGISLSGSSSSYLTFLDHAVKSPHPMVQRSALQILANLHEDKCLELISVGLKSSFLQIRFETLFYLIQRKSPNALGQTESLINLLPPQAKPLFVELYAMHGSFEAISILKQYMNDKDPNVRLAAVLYSALYQRDDLLNSIRSILTQSDPVLKEAACFAIGHLRDLNSKDLLIKSSKLPFNDTKLSALIALYKIGDHEAKNEIMKMAKDGNLHAIHFLSEIPDSDNLLEELANRIESAISLNATLALLNKKNPKALPHVIEILMQDPQVSGFAPSISLGHSLMSWKPISIQAIKDKDQKNSMIAISLNFQEELLAKCLELPNKSFIELAKIIMNKRQTKLIPLLIRLLENEGSDETKALLIEKAYAIENPLLRSYAKLALYRMHVNEHYRHEFLKWLSHQKNTKMIEFRPQTDASTSGKHKTMNHFSPEEISGLFVEAFDALASNHDKEGIEFLLESLRDGHSKNRFAFAGLLLKSIH
jgi:HEAT repeat protein